MIIYKKGDYLRAYCSEDNEGDTTFIVGESMGSLSLVTDRFEGATICQSKLHEVALKMKKKKLVGKTTNRNKVKDRESFANWLLDDNVIHKGNGVYTEQTTQWKKEFTYDELEAFYIKEYEDDQSDRVEDLHEEARNMMIELDLRYNRDTFISLDEYYLKYKDVHSLEESEEIMELINKF